LHPASGPTDHDNVTKVTAIFLKNNLLSWLQDKLGFLVALLFFFGSARIVMKYFSSAAVALEITRLSRISCFGYESNAANSIYFHSGQERGFNCNLGLFRFKHLIELTIYLL
jgi:hypothetical protein